MSAETSAPEVLTVNIGNTHTSTMAWGGGGQPDAPARWTTDFRTMQAVAKHAASAKNILVASVVKSCSHKLLNDLADLDRKPQVFRADVMPMLEIAPYPPDRVGDDRIAGSLGALALDPASSWIVIDAGTALTCNAISPARPGHAPRFEGGLIAPGFAMSLRALGQGTAQLPALNGSSFEAPSFEFIGRNTEQAMFYGVVAMQCAAVRGMVEGQRDALGGTAKIVLTGGGALFLMEALRRGSGPKFELIHEPNLVHRGLFEAWKTTTRPA